MSRKDEGSIGQPSKARDSSLTAPIPHSPPAVQTGMGGTSPLENWGEEAPPPHPFAVSYELACQMGDPPKSMSRVLRAA